MFSRSSTGSVGRQWAKVKLDRFRAFFLDPGVIRACQVYRRCRPSEVALTTRASDVVRKVVRVVLPFRRELADLPRQVHELGNLWRPFLKAETGVDVEFAVAWSSAGRNLRSFFAQKAAPSVVSGVGGG